MALVVLNYRVKDYDEWRSHFDLDENKKRRQKTGIISEKVYCENGDKNNVSLFFTTNDYKKVLEMLKDPEIKEVMDEAGVISEPIVKVLMEAKTAIEHA